MPVENQSLLGRQRTLRNCQEITCTIKVSCYATIMESSSIIETVRQKFELLRPVMTERMRRHWAASEALALPRGGITMVAAATGLSRTTITAGMRALRSGAAPEGEVDGSRSRQPGGGRPLVEDIDATV